jgi:hypothetical protein
MRRFIYVFAVLLGAAPAWGQAQEKAEIVVSNGRNEPLVMRFDYAFRQYSWRLMEHEIAVGDEITYRFPSNIPGCEKLHEWGIADGVLTVSNAAGPLCQQRVSLCDKSAVFMDVGPTRCTWQKATAGQAALHP